MSLVVKNVCSDAMLKLIGTHCQNLHYLDISNSFKVSDVGIESLCCQVINHTRTNSHTVCFLKSYVLNLPSFQVQIRDREKDTRHSDAAHSDPNSHPTGSTSAVAGSGTEAQSPSATSSSSSMRLVDNSWPHSRTLAGQNKI